MTSLFDKNSDLTICKTKATNTTQQLITYDLYNAFKYNKSAGFNNIEIIDIYLLETILEMGKYHKNYFTNSQSIPEYGIKKHIQNISQNNLSNNIDDYYQSNDFCDWIIEYSEQLKNNAVKTGVWKHYCEIELPFAIAMLSLTKNGIKLNSTLIDNIYSGIHQAKQKIYFALEANSLCGTSINDLNDWINGYGYNEYFPAGRDNLTIQDIALLEDHHQVFKIFSRYEKVKRIENIINKLKQTSTVFPQFMMIVSSTTRCTSRDPNIMGLPKIFRPIVIPSQKNYGIVECDYAQMEVGIIAALANDKNLIYDFNNSDVYQTVGDLLFKRKDAASRKKAKIIFLGILYGLSKRTLAKRLSLNTNETESLLATLFNRYQPLLKFLSQTEEFGRINGYSINITGLKRYRINRCVEPTYWEKNWFKNFPVQASASSVFKRAIVRINSALKSADFNLLIPHYDAVVFEAPLNQLKQYILDVKSCMVKSMQEYFPNLMPKISVNDYNPTCWNDEGQMNSVDKFIRNPLYGINVKEKRTGNIDWSEYI